MSGPAQAADSPTLLMILGDAPFFLTHFLPIAQAAKARGFEVQVATPIDPGSGRNDEAAASRIEAAGFSFHRISLQRAGANPFAELQLVRELDALIARLKPALIHCFGLKPILYAGSIARLRRIASVCAVIGLGLPFMQRGPRAGLQRVALKRVLAFAFKNPRCRVTVENEQDRDIVLSTGAIDGARITRLNGAGVDLTVFHPFTDNAPAAEAAPVIMFAARLIAPKGIYDFVEAARRIKARGVAARFVLQCQYDLRNRQAVSEAEIRRWQDERIVEWWGPSTNMPEALHRADIFCLPTYYREGLPKVLIEAAASGLPIVTTDQPGCRDAVVNGESGLLIEPRHIDQLEAALLRLLTDAAFRSSAGKRSRALAVERFSVDAVIATYLGVYDAAMGSAGRRFGPAPVSASAAPR